MLCIRVCLFLLRVYEILCREPITLEIKFNLKTAKGGRKWCRRRGFADDQSAANRLQVARRPDGHGGQPRAVRPTYWSISS